jgi:hypothetical protein
MDDKALKRILVLAAGVLLWSPVLRAQDATVRIVDNVDERAFEIIVGPFELPAGTRAAAEMGGMDHGGHDAHGGAVYAPVTTVEAPESVYLTGFSYTVRDGSGAEISSEFLHHLNIINPDNRELFLPISQRMLAVGKETGSQSMPGLLMGYPVPAGTRMVVTAMMHNPSADSLHGVVVTVRLDYVSAGRPWPLFNVFPFQLDVAFPAGDKSWDLPPGRHTWSYEASPMIAGRLMGIGGHLHENAESLVFEDVTDGKVIWEGRPIEDESGIVTGVTVGRLYRKGGVKLHPDHRYRVSVTYLNETADTIFGGGMGVIGGVFMQRGSGMWPLADKSLDLYVLDRAHYMRQVFGKLDEIQGEVGTATHEH